MNVFGTGTKCCQQDFVRSHDETVRTTAMFAPQAPLRSNTNNRLYADWMRRSGLRIATQNLYGVSLNRDFSDDTESNS
jgi:hypothetical protein